MQGDKYLDVGGGIETQPWTLAILTAIDATALQAIASKGYQGVCFDIEIGNVGLAAAFTAAFARVKAANLKVMVTMSHSAPYYFPDSNNAEGKMVMDAILASPNVDIIAPQLYGGSTLALDLQPTRSNNIIVPFSSIGASGTKAKIMPILPAYLASSVSQTQAMFSGLTPPVIIAGCILWTY